MKTLLITIMLLFVLHAGCKRNSMLIPTPNRYYHFVIDEQFDLSEIDSIGDLECLKEEMEKAK